MSNLNQVASYFYRQVLSIGFIILGCIWPLFGLDASFRSKNSLFLTFWALACVGTSVFLWLPVGQDEDMLLFNMGGIAIVLLGIAAAEYCSLEKSNPNQKIHWILRIQTLICGLSVLLVNSTQSYLALKEKLPLPNQVAAWLLFLGSLLFSFGFGIRHASTFIARYALIFLGFAPTMILLSIRFELLFYASSAVTLAMWLLLEQRIYAFGQVLENKTSLNKTLYRALKLSDVRLALLFLFFINVAFFGTGNVGKIISFFILLLASLASFQISSVYRLTTIFDPVLMAGLLILKILIPFSLLSATFGLLSRSLQLPPFSLFLFVVSTTGSNYNPLLNFS